MSGKSNTPKYSPSRTDTRIGAGARVDGDMTFTGVLRVQGTVLGDVSCDADGSGTLVVGESGSVAGTMRAPHIVVGGTASGPAYSSESIEVQAGARLEGDTFYKELQVQAGGVIEGLLTPTSPLDMDRMAQQRRLQAAERTAVDEGERLLADSASTRRGYRVRSLAGRMVGGLAIVLVTVMLSLYVNQEPTSDSSPSADTALKADASIKVDATAPAAPALGAALQGSSGDAGADATRPMPASDANKDRAVEAPAADLADVDPGQVVAVQGVNPGKPAGVLSVVSDGPSVVFKRKRQDTSSGTRIDVPRGASTIPIAKDELLRVAEGRNLVIFYQGRKVGPKTIEAGAWMSFIPHARGGEDGNQ